MFRSNTEKAGEGSVGEGGPKRLRILEVTCSREEVKRQRTGEPKPEMPEVK